MKRGIVFIFTSLILLFGVSIAMNFSSLMDTITSFPFSHADCIFAFLAGAALMRLICWLVPSSKHKKKPHDNEEQ